MKIGKLEKRTNSFFEKIDTKNVFIIIYGIITILLSLVGFIRSFSSSDISFRRRLLFFSIAYFLLGIMIFNKKKPFIQKIWFLPTIFIAIYSIMNMANTNFAEIVIIDRVFDVLTVFLISKFINYNYIILNKEKKKFYRLLHIIPIIYIIGIILLPPTNIGGWIINSGPFILIFFCFRNKKITTLNKWIIFFIQIFSFIILYNIIHIYFYNFSISPLVGYAVLWEDLCEIIKILSFIIMLDINNKILLTKATNEK